MRWPWNFSLVSPKQCLNILSNLLEIVQNYLTKNFFYVSLTISSVIFRFLNNFFTVFSTLFHTNYFSEIVLRPEFVAASTLEGRCTCNLICTKLNVEGPYQKLSMFPFHPCDLCLPLGDGCIPLRRFSAMIRELSIS